MKKITCIRIMKGYVNQIRTTFPTFPLTNSAFDRVEVSHRSHNLRTHSPQDFHTYHISHLSWCGFSANLASSPSHRTHRQTRNHHTASRSQLGKNVSSLP